MTYHITTHNGIQNAENRSKNATFANGRPRIFIFSASKAELFFQKAD